MEEIFLQQKYLQCYQPHDETQHHTKKHFYTAINPTLYYPSTLVYSDFKYGPKIVKTVRQQDGCVTETVRGYGVKDRNLRRKP